MTLIQISERDTQVSDRPKRPGEFVNTWSIDGFMDEAMQPSEISFGTAEKQRPTGHARPPARLGDAVHEPARRRDVRAQLDAGGRRVPGH